MAVSDNLIVARHYAAQKAIALQVERDLRRSGLTGMQAQEAAAALVARYAPASVAVARNYYADLREASRVPGRFTAPVEKARSAESAFAYIEGAAAAQTTLTQETADLFVARVAAMLVSDAGRGQVISASRADPRSTRWARVTSGSSCAFCLMLATRGAAYRSQDTADFRSHRGCHCSVQPVFKGVPYEPPAHIRQAQSLWSESTDGLHNRDALNAFRRAVG